MMKRIFSFSQYLLLACFLFSSCKKTSEEVQTTTEFSRPELAKRVNAWLDDQMPFYNETGRQLVTGLKNGLLSEEIWLERRNEEESFIVVPLKPDFKTEYNQANKPLMHLLLSMNTSGKITAGNIIQFVPKRSQPKMLPKNTLAKVYNHQRIDGGGKYTVLKITGAYQLTLSYENGLLARVQRPLKRKAESQTQRTNGCYLRYLITSYYDREGNFLFSTEQLVDSYCLPCGVIGPDGSSTPCTDLNNDDSTGGGGGTPTVIYEYATARERSNGLLMHQMIGTISYM